MDLLPGADEEEIRRAAADYLAGELPVSRCHRADADRLDPVKLAEIGALGWFGLSLSEAKGGVGLSAVDEVMLFREVGRFLGPVTLLATALAARTAVESGNGVLADRIMSGKVQVALAVRDPQLPDSLRVFDWREAALALCADDRSAALLGLEVLHVEPVECLDKTVSMGIVAQSSLSIEAEAPGDSVARTGALNAAAMLVGMAEVELDMIVEYARIRETFGRPIGAYQAVRHPCADMAVRCEAARSQLYSAAVAWRDGLADARPQIDAAKLLANQAAVRNADSNIQLHGGIAVTMEHDAHLYMKRANLMARLFDTDNVLADRLLEAKVAA